MNKFSLTVSGISRKEYFQACREAGRRMRIILALSMLAFCGLIVVFTGNASIASILGPVIIYVIVAGGYELLPRLTYKNELEVIDPPVEYDFNGARWSIKKGDVTADIDWKATPALRKTGSCLFLYNDETTSNLLPLRLLTDQQVNALETWFRHSREQYKLYRRKQDQNARNEFKKNHSHLRLGRTGPAWGPRKRR